MKSLITIACALLLIGCSDENPNTATSVQTSPPTVVEENITTDAPTVETPVVTTPPANPIATIDGATLYSQKCASCHGAKAEKSALNTSQVIAGWNDMQVKDALTGYQAGTYGKKMKAIMQGQAKTLNEAQIGELSKYISTL